MKPVISVIIPTYHRNDLLKACLNCLLPDTQTISSDKYEVIVTDDGRKTTAQQLILDQYPWVRWIKGPQRGPAANRNNGVEAARGSWIVFTDDDCLPKPSWLLAYYSAIKNNNTFAVFEGKTIADRPKNRLDEEAPINESGGNLWSCNFSIARHVFDEVGGFDECFPYPAMEDIDLHFRLREAHYFPKFVKNALVIHPYRRISPTAHKFRYKSFVYFLNKHDLINIKYRLSRAKHFLHYFLLLLQKYAKYNCTGFRSLIEENVLNFKLIFAPKIVSKKIKA